MNSGNRACKLWACLCVGLGIGFALALRVAMEERKAVAELRSPMTATATARSVEPGPAAELWELPAPPGSEAAITPSSNTLVIPPAQEREAMASVAQRHALQEQNEKLETVLRQTVAELENAKRDLAERDDTVSSYVGPGTWINVNGQTRSVTKLIISPGAFPSGLAVRAWARCHPTDCEWDEVEFLLLSLMEPPEAYRRGFAAWESGGHHRYLIITFEKSGIKLDCISIPANRAIAPHRSVERMTRLN